MPPLEFQLNLTGTFAASMAGANKELRDADGHLKKAKEGVGLFEAEIGKLSGSVGGLTTNLGEIGKGGHFFQFDLAEAAVAAYEAIAKVVEKVVELGVEMVKSAGQTQDLDLAINLDVGEANVPAINELAESLSRTSRFDDDAIKKAMLPLLEQGITDTKKLDDFTTAAIDIATRRNQGEGAVAGYLDTLGKLSLGGKLKEGTLKELAIAPASFYANLGDLLHTSAAGAKKAIAEGKVKTDTLMSVVMDEIAKREGGALGKAGVAGSQTLGATLQRISDLPENLFKRAADSPGMKQVQATLDKFIEFASGPKGDAAVAAVADALGRIAEGAGPFIEKLPEYIADASAVFGVLGSIVGFVADLFDALGTDIGVSVAQFYLIGEAIWDFFAGLPAMASKFYDAAIDIGADLIQGIVDGVKGAAGAVWDAIGEVAESSVQQFKDLLGIHSPSAVFADLGGSTTEGFAVGMEDGAARVGGAAAGIVTAGTDAAQSAARGAILDTAGIGPGSAPAMMADAAPPAAPSISVEVNVTTGAHNAEDVGLEIAQKVRIEIRKVMSEIGYALGAAA